MKKEPDQTGGAELRLTIPGPPVPMARPRVSRHGGVFTSAKQRAHRKTLAAFLTGAAKANGWKLGYRGPLELEIVCVFERAKSNKTTHHTQRPDASNLAKLIEDTANGILWHDDSQVIDLRVRKIWGIPARTEVNVRQI
jgi:Holliday junction resolvase RusA-like endonuclease